MLATSPNFIDATPAIDFTRIGDFSGLAWFDYDNDGNQDVFLANNQRTGGGKLFHNNGDGTFVDATEQAGISDRIRSSSAVAGDLDNDGNTDLIVTHFQWTGTTGRTTVYHNNGDGTLQEVADSAGIVPPFTPASMSLADVDGDSFLDLFINATGSFGTGRQYDSLIFRNNGDMTFADVTTDSGIDAGLGACASGFSDYDNDGDSDLFVANCNNLSILKTPMQLFRNDGGFKFTDVSESSGLGAQLGFWMAVTFADYDSDGNMDAFATSTGAGPGNAPHGLFRNNGDGTFTNTADEAGLAAWEFGWGASFADFNNDGHSDLFFAGTLAGTSVASIGANGNPGRLFMNNLADEEDPVPTFSDASAALGIDVSNSFTSGVAVADYDNDGFQDIFVMARSRTADASPNLLHNEGNSNHWLGIELVGTESNRDAVGARVTVEAEGLTSTQEVTAGTSFLSMDSQSLRIGLGQRTVAKVVRVAWPSGRDEWFFTGGAVDQIMTFVEGSGMDPVVGDSNFDGQFDTGDLITVFQEGEYEDGVAGNSRWADGDWNGDHEFDSGDLVVAFAAGTFEKPPAAVATDLAIAAWVDAFLEEDALSEKRAAAFVA